MASVVFTDRQRKFAELWAADPEHNGTKAAREAGYTGDDATLAATASRLIRTAKVKAHIDSLRGEAIELQRSRAVASLAEVLEHASGMIRLDLTEALGSDGELSVEKLKALPPEQRRALQIEVQSTTDSEGQVFARQKVKRDPTALAAAKLLVEHYEGAKKPEGGDTYVLNINGMDPETLRKLYSQGWLNGEAKRLPE